MLSNTSNTPMNCELGLKPCPHCNRTFSPSVLAKHAMICSRGMKKRPVFDSSLQRCEGLDLPSVERSLDGEAHGLAVADAPPKSRGVTFQIKQEPATKPSQRKAAAAPTVSTPAVAPRSTAGRESSLASRSAAALERCPHCDRSFSQKAFENHVAFCKEKSVVAAFSTNCSDDNIQSAKKRMEARMNYKPPAPKTKQASNPHGSL